ncbi:MAG TPA: nicotinate phosphoribosyltransferase, partial [Longimicrobiales bacterium]|nr:nicotinate phosphoribosyltransferase [Longimicrobiales bacterium]
MSNESNWVTPDNVGLLTDLYELTMLQAFWEAGMHGEAVFTTFVRRLPRDRNYLLAAGLDDALAALEALRFTTDSLDYLATLPQFRPAFLEWLAEWRFEGDVYAVPEGTPVFANEPILEVVAPIAQAQLPETVIMNQLHYQTLVATKGARVVHAAKGRKVVDFGLRRIHGYDAGIKSARAFYIAGVDATSNVLAGRLYGIPVAGTMAHSFVQAYDHEIDAFRAFARLYPGTTLLVDTYDTLEGVRRAVEVARELAPDSVIGAIRLDSGDLADLARRARAILDDAGFPEIRIFASGGLDEYEVAALVDAGAPIDAFGVGTAMGVSADAPSLDIAYKLTEYGGRGRIKLSPGKAILPGRKQVFRLEDAEGRAVRDIIARWDEDLPGRPLLEKVMERGRRLDPGRSGLEAARARA